MRSSVLPRFSSRASALVPICGYSTYHRFDRFNRFNGSDPPNQLNRLNLLNLLNLVEPGSALEHVLGDEPDVRRAFGEAAHVPGEPVLAVADEAAGRDAGLAELLLARGLNAEEHR